jgi:hypothetical protein
MERGVRKPVHLMGGEEQEEGNAFHNPHQGHTSNDPKLATRPHLLMFSTTPNSTKQRIKILEDIPDPNYSKDKFINLQCCLILCHS